MSLYLSSILFISFTMQVSSLPKAKMCIYMHLVSSFVYPAIQPIMGKMLLNTF